MTIATFVDASALGSPAGHYSHPVRANGFIFVSGLLPRASCKKIDEFSPVRL